MQTLYIITGPAGVGKSTISLKVAESLPKSVLIEGDDIYNQVVCGYVSPWKEGNHLDVFWKVSISIIKEYVAEGYDVVFNYIISPKNLARIREALGDIKIKFVVLLADEDTLLKRDALRPLDCQMKERCIVLLHNFIEHHYEERFVIDTGKLSVEEVVREVLVRERFAIS